MQCIVSEVSQFAYMRVSVGEWVYVLCACIGIHIYAYTFHFSIMCSLTLFKRLKHRVNDLIFSTFSHRSIGDH